MHNRRGKSMDEALIFHYAPVLIGAHKVTFVFLFHAIRDKKQTLFREANVPMCGSDIQS
jgi:hypothetical protein